jgi:hypothetical protein
MRAVEREAIARIIVDAVRTINRVIASGMHEGQAINEAVDQILALLSPSTDLAEGVEGALSGVSDDFMTSEVHHPGYVLIPTAKFEQLCRAEAALSPTQVGGLGTGSACTESTDAPAFGAAEDARRKSEDAAPRVYHYGAALHGIADEHADVLTPRQRKALYEAGNLLWDASTERGVVVVSRAEARRLVNYAFMASSANWTPYIKENGVGYQESPWVEFLRVADRLWTVLFPDHPIRQIDPRLPAESGDAVAVAKQRASALPATDHPNNSKPTGEA